MREPMAWWARRGTAVLWTATAILLMIAAWRLTHEFHRLVWAQSYHAAIDLRNMHGWVHDWFDADVDSQPVRRGDYPPASIALLLPLIGWLPYTAARVWWAISSLGMIGWLSWWLLQGSRARPPVERLFLLSLILASSGLAVTIGNGQLILHLLPAVLTAITLLRRQPASWGRELGAAALLLIGLIKASVTLPFFWLAGFHAGRWRPLVLVGVGYLALTILATSFASAGLVAALLECFQRSTAAVANYAGCSNLHQLLIALGLRAWLVPASALLFCGLGWWTYRHRNADEWVLLAVAAIIARLWTYHRPYDDVLMLVPAMTLFRLAGDAWRSATTRVVAGGWFVILAITLIFPDRLRYYAWPWGTVVNLGHAVVWVAVLVFLASCAAATREPARIA